MSIVIGIDQSYTSTGICVLNSDKQILELSTLTAAISVGDIFARANHIADEVCKLVEKYSPIGVGIEGLAYAMTGDATRDLAGLLFVIVNKLRYTHKFDKITSVPPNTLKKMATGKGNAKKEMLYTALPEDVKKLIEAKNYRKTTGMYDVTDAYWIAIYTLGHFQTRTD